MDGIEKYLLDSAINFIRVLTPEITHHGDESHGIDGSTNRLIEKEFDQGVLDIQLLWLLPRWS